MMDEGTQSNEQKLEAEVARLKEQLQPYLDADEAERKQALWDERLELLVDICIPSYSMRNQKNRPICHPKTSSWWNGASVTGSEVLANGNVKVDVRSYVGGNEYDTDDIILLKEWFDVDNPTSVVQNWCVTETARLEEVRKEYVRKETLNKIEHLTKQLANLEKRT